ncbi:MAG: hypothetical protein ACFFDH_16310 [Promethearchaeota archaeon]
MTEYETFMVYELDNSGERMRLDINEEELQSKLYPEQVLVIVREDLRRIFIWKGPKSPVRKRFISSRVAQAIQEELMNDAGYHRCKIVSVDAGDEPSEFLNAFRLESMEVTERLADMRYVRNIERERGVQATIKDMGNEVVLSSYATKGKPSFQRPAMTKPSTIYKAEGLSEEHQQKIKDKIIKIKVPDNFKRSNLILGHTLYAAVSKKAKVFGKDVEETEWEPIKNVPEEMIELESQVLRVYFDDKKGIVEAVEVLEKDESQTSGKKPPLSPMPSKPASLNKTSVETTPSEKLDGNKEVINFNSMTVKDLKAYAEENKIDLPSNARKAEIIEILEKSRENKSSDKRQLPKIPSMDD